MSFSTKRAIRKLSSTKTKAKPTGTDSRYTTQDLPSLRRKRTIAMNRMSKALEVGLLAKEDDSQCDLFLSYCDQAKKIASDFEQAHFSILEVLGDGSDDDDERDDQVRTRFDESYFQVMSMRRAFTKADLNASKSDSIRDSSSLSNIKLPKLQLPTFSGDVKKWPEFFDTFNALIHDSTSLTAVEKFHYLTSSLSGDPLALIRVFPITGDYYSDAYATLVSRYQDKRELAFTCWRDFLNVNFKSQSPIEFRRTLDNIDENLSILNKLKLPVNQWDFVIVYHVLSKLDPKLRRDFEEKCTKSEFPKYSQLKDFLHSKCEALVRDSHFSEQSKSSGSAKETFKPSNLIVKRSNVTHTLLTENSKQTSSTPIEENNKTLILKCSFCADSHPITQCKSFLAKSVDERRTAAKERGWCYNCLKGSHQLRNCFSIFRCLKCRSKHHSLICDSVDREGKANSITTNSKSVSLVAKGSGPISIVRSSKNTTVLLATAMIQLQDRYGKYHSFRAIFDTGSQNNFITRKAAQCLNFEPVPCEANINGLGGAAAEITGLIKCSIAARNCTLFDIDMYVMTSICGDQPIAKLQTQGWSHIETLHLADPGFDIPGPVDVLLGADVFADSVLDEHVKGDARQPLAINSLFGWLLLGRTPLITSSLLQASPGFDDLTSIVQRFWELDIVPKATSLTPEEVACENSFVNEHYRDSSGRYGVRLPFKDQLEPTFCGSRDIAVRRFKAIEKRLLRDPLLHKQYAEFMEDYLQSGHMSLVASKDLHKGRYYIPHHCVVKPDSATTKLRVVFDASAEDLNHKSLNNTLLTGPKLQSNIVEVLLHFRLHAIVFMADIRQMYRQILVSDSHRDYQRIVWRSGPDQVLQEFRLNTVTYGVSSAPFLACRTIKQLAEDEGSRFPLAKLILSTDIYVDDVVTGCDTLNEAFEAKSQITQLFSLGHFQLRKWASNEPGLLADLSPEDCLFDPKRFSDGQPPTLKVLGLKWDPATDTFLFDAASKSSSQSCTKRIILSELARIFDPLGFLSPLTIKAKCLIQRLWVLGVSWDEEPPEEVTHAWKTLCEQLSSLQELHLPRRLTIDSAATYELHGFCDSSELAYGAVIYLRAKCDDGSIQIRLLCAKARVTPIKRISLPRLELCSAVLLADLTKFVQETYLHKVSVHAIHLWSDSTVVLSWLRSHSSRWTTFVANRVSHIQDTFPADSWHHVSSPDNPADVCSRGQFPQDLLQNSLWWSGPSWLSLPSTQWPNYSKFPFPTDDDDSLVRQEERQPIALVAHVSDSQESPIDILLKRFSSLEKITRIVSYMRRFIYNLKHPNERQIGSLFTEAEKTTSLLLIVKLVQKATFQTEIERLLSKQLLEKPLRKLNPFLDEEGILRVGGRLARAGLEFEQRHPALLPSNHPFTYKLIESVHRQHCHTGHNTTHYLILQRFWILSPKRAIRRCLSECIRCFKTQPKSLEPYMSDLPVYRVNQVKPFSVVGVDFGGPFRIKVGRYRGAKMDKAYLCLFICLATKAVHLEVVSSLSADSFIAALRRFVGRRGRCNVIHADRGTNFVGASNYLALLEQASHTENIRFEFNPPSAPHFGGVWEIQIKAAKSHLYRVVGNQVLTFEELTTLFVQIEAVLNSRPLCPLSADPNDLNVLTPGHFLTLEPLTVVPDEDLSNVKLYRLNRWQLIQSFIQNFWIRWKNEYLNSLTQRAKWTKASRPLNLNSIVVIKDDNRTPLQWSMGRVIDLHPGPDGIVRVATIKIKDSLIKRPLVKLCPLPIESAN